MRRALLVTLAAVAIIFQAVPAVASHQKASVEVGIWIHGGIPEMQALEKSLGLKFGGAKWYNDWDDPWRAWIPEGYHNVGYVPEMSWQPMITQANGTNLGVANNDILAGQYDAYIDETANGVKALPFRVRISMGNEFNGPWNPWGLGKVGNTVDNHKLAWRYVVDRFRQLGANNVDWVWTPNIDPDHVLPAFSQMYPGDDYVTYFGLDGYNFGTSLPGGSWRSFRSLYQSSYDELQAIANKDIYIIEMGSVEQGGDKAKWIKDFFDDLESRYPKIKGITWWNVAYPEYDMRLQTSGAAMIQFAASVNGPPASNEPPPSDTGSGAGSPATSQPATETNNQPATSSSSTDKPPAKPTNKPQVTDKADPVSLPTTQAPAGFTLGAIVDGIDNANPNLLIGLSIGLIAILVVMFDLAVRSVSVNAKKIERLAEREEKDLELIARR